MNRAARQIEVVTTLRQSLFFCPEPVGFNQTCTYCPCETGQTSIHDPHFAYPSRDSIIAYLPKSPFRVIKRPVTAGAGAASTLASFSRKLSGYKNLDILGPYAILEHIKENDFCEKPARFEDKVRDVITPVYCDQ